MGLLKCSRAPLRGIRLVNQAIERRTRRPWLGPIIGKVRLQVMRFFSGKNIASPRSTLQQACFLPKKADYFPLFLEQAMKNIGIDEAIF